MEERISLSYLKQYGMYKNKYIRRFEILYKKYQNNTISNRELDELLEISEDQNIMEGINGPLKDHWNEIRFDHPFTLSKHTKIHKRRSTVKIVGWSIAASLAVMIATSIWFWNRDLGWMEYSTSNGETVKIELSDQSKVLLNANSKIRWNEDWEKNRLRKIELTGEAYFDIAQMDAVPLIVESTNATIQVLGTSFNVREDAHGTDVYLYEGKIKLEFYSESDDSTQLLMTRGDRVIKPIGSSKPNIYSGVRKMDAASWTEGELRFRNQPLGEILDRLESIYGKSFVVEDTSMLAIPMDVGVPYANWAVMKSALELSLGVELEENGEGIKLKR